MEMTECTAYNTHYSLPADDDDEHNYEQLATIIDNEPEK